MLLALFPCTKHFFSLCLLRSEYKQKKDGYSFTFVMSTYHFFLNVTADHVAMAAVTYYNASFEIPKFCIAKDKWSSLFLIWVRSLSYSNY